MPDFLLEIGCEEIPARMLDAAAQEFARRVRDLLEREHLADAPKVESFSTPRRLAASVHAVSGKQPDVTEDVTGPSLKIAFKDGKPTPAAEAFAKKVGLPVDKLDKVTTAKGEYLAAKVTKKGRRAAEVLADFLPGEIAKLYWPKSMYWRAGKPERFVRPVRWLVALLDGEVVPVEFAGIRADRISHGHRVFGNQVKLASAQDYASALEHACVIAKAEDREQKIRKALDAATRAVPGARWREDQALLDTVVNLTEWPAAILGNFDKEFLALPEEVLVTVMRDHQKYFAVEDAQGKLAPHFLAVLNTEPDAAGIDVIRHGNERVLRARFNDARFFWETDQKHPLKDRVEMLKHVTFQKDLGNYHEKAERVARLANELAADLSTAGVKLDRGAVHEAAWLAKTDLTTELVKEFTELQGVVGGLYARAQRLAPAVADAIYDHYKPESMDDAAPRTLEGAVLSLADKADSIAGMFALGLAPTGSKDPFALRRQANGIVKTLAEHKLRLRLTAIFKAALEGYKGSEAAKKFKTGDYDSAIAAFFRERLEFYLRESQGLAYDVVNAVLAAGADDVVDAVARARAVTEVRPSDDFESISIAFKRMKNILRQAREEKKRVADRLDPKLFEEEAENALAGQLPHIAGVVERHHAQGDYAAALREISRLRPLVDRFFDKVMVMVEDEKVRANRLALMEKLVRDFSIIADFAEIVTERKGP
ncbi:MAG TPA: glycine--tRNA ligase subunit beta [Terriglobales bacterium]|nr:glycine--tRNA ligase subunit beta [Terriglobales bacterium]